MFYAVTSFLFRYSFEQCEKLQYLHLIAFIDFILLFIISTQRHSNTHAPDPTTYKLLTSPPH